MKTVKNKSLCLKDAHLFRMVDDTGMLKTAQRDVPDPRGGYTLNDNARLLMTAAMGYETTGKKQYLDLAYKAMSFLLAAEHDDWFSDDMGYDRHFKQNRASEECYGRAIMVLGYAASTKRLPKGLRKTAKALMMRACESSAELVDLRASAYVAQGIAHCRYSGCREKLAEHLARISAAYFGNAKPGWFWYEDTMMSCNAALPHALLSGYQVLGGDKLRDIGLESLGFLLESTTRDGFFWPVGCHGWSKRGSEAALYDQLPVEACNILLCCLKAYEITEDEMYLNKALLCFDWFLGGNSAGEAMIDPRTGGCYDRITRDGVSRNQSAESLLSWMLSTFALQQLHDGPKEA